MGHLAMEPRQNPFYSLDSTYEYISLLQEALHEARDSVENDTHVANQEGATRRVQALQIVSYKLHCLDEHMRASRRLLNDLRMLRRTLFDERGAPSPVKRSDRPATP